MEGIQHLLDQVYRTNTLFDRNLQYRWKTMCQKSIRIEELYSRILDQREIEIAKGYMGTRQDLFTKQLCCMVNYRDNRLRLTLILYDESNHVGIHQLMKYAYILPILPSRSFSDIVIS